MGNLLSINDQEAINPAFIVFVRKVAGGLELHLHGGIVLYANDPAVLETPIEAVPLVEAEKAPAKKGK